MTDKKQNTLDRVSAICDATDDALASYTDNDNIQLPVLVGMVAARMGWNTKQLRENDPIVRFYIRNHPDYAITKGPHGGVIPRAAWEKKQGVKAAKEQAKQEMQAKLDEMLANNAAASVMQQVANQEAALDAKQEKPVSVDEGRKAFLDTMVDMGQKLLDEQVVEKVQDDEDRSSTLQEWSDIITHRDDPPVHDVSEVEDVFADLDEDEGAQEEEFDELSLEL